MSFFYVYEPPTSDTTAVVQSLSCVRLFETPWAAACQGPLVLHHLPEFVQTRTH